MNDKLISLSQINNELNPIIIGSPVYNDSDGSVKLAQATDGLKNVIGLVGDDIIASLASGSIQVVGFLTATVAQWDAVFSTIGGLTKGTRYYLSALLPGIGTSVIPIISGQYLIELGIALSSTSFMIEIKRPILL